MKSSLNINYYDHYRLLFEGDSNRMPQFVVLLLCTLFAFEDTKGNEKALGGVKICCVVKGKRQVNIICKRQVNIQLRLYYQHIRKVNDVRITTVFTLAKKFIDDI